MRNQGLKGQKFRAPVIMKQSNMTIKTIHILTGHSTGTTVGKCR